MNIAYFTDNYLPQPSGIATSVDHFARFLRKLGHKVYIFAPKVKGYKDEGDFVFRLPSVRVMPNLPDGARLPLPFPYHSFWKTIEVDFDIVHAHGNGAFSLLGLAVARAKKYPLSQPFISRLVALPIIFLKGKLSDQS